MKKLLIMSALALCNSIICMQKSDITATKTIEWLDQNRSNIVFVIENEEITTEFLHDAHDSNEPSGEGKAKKIIATLLLTSQVKYDKKIFLSLDPKAIVPLINKYLLEARRLQAIDNLTEKPSNNGSKIGFFISGTLIGCALCATGYHFFMQNK